MTVLSRPHRVHLRLTHNAQTHTLTHKHAHTHNPTHTQDCGELPERVIALIAYETVKVVAACHERDIMHGDIKVRLQCVVMGV